MDLKPPTGPSLSPFHERHRRRARFHRWGIYLSFLLGLGVFLVWGLARLGPCMLHDADVHSALCQSQRGLYALLLIGFAFAAFLSNELAQIVVLEDGGNALSRRVRSVKHGYLALERSEKIYIAIALFLLVIFLLGIIKLVFLSRLHFS